MTKREEAGLRITLPADRTPNQPVGFKTTMVLSGDFEITAAYELLAADPPTTGYGVGVNLGLAPDGARKKYAKVGRFMRPGRGVSI